MTRFLRLIGLVGALLVLAFGFLQPAEREITWLVSAWSATILAGMALWFGLPPRNKGQARSVYRLMQVFVACFGLIAVHLLRQQFVDANAIAARSITTESGAVVGNIRPVLEAQRVIRGSIIDKNGFVLVRSEAAADGQAHRTYPLTERYGPEYFSAITGFFSPRFGQSGLELTYSDWLSNERGNPVGRLQDEALGHPVKGNDLHLTLDAALQAQTAQLLGDRRGSVVLLDPHTGAILALASTPGFDPRQLSFDPGAANWEAENSRIAAYWEQINLPENGQPLLDRATQGLYPPGSTFKTLTAIAVLEHPEIGKPNEITCPEKLETENGAPPVINAIPNLANLTGNPSNLERVYAYSCNAAFAQYALRLGPDIMIQTAERFGIAPPGSSEGRFALLTDLPTAQSSMAVDADFLQRPAALADTGYGQGQLLITPLQMAEITAAIGNDGMIMMPYLVQQITRPDGTIIWEHQPQSLNQAMSSGTAARMRSLMQAVAAYGFGRVISSRVPGVTVGGKSGTAQHTPGAPTHAWFIALAPIEQPRYAVAVMLEQGGEGSGPAAILAGDVLNAAFERERVSPTP